jgi:hypothetical protein
MSAGFLHQNVCYASLAEATAAHWSANPVFITPGTTSYISDTVWSGTAWVIKKYTLSSAGALTLNSTTTAPTLAFPTCETGQEFLDGMTVGWGVAAAVIGAWVIKNLRRSL